MKSLLLTLPLSIAILLTGCSTPSVREAEKSSIFAMDTYMSFTVYGDAVLLEDAEHLIRSIEESVSVTDENSAIYAVNHTGEGILSANSADLLERSLALCRRTDGALDISIYPVVRAWGFTTGDHQVPDEDALRSLQPLVDYRRIGYNAAAGAVTLPEGMEIDLGSVAKGYAGQLVAQMLRDNGVQSALLDLGGNVQTVGSKPDGSPWKIGIKDPRGEEVMMVLYIKDQAVVTSGGYERYFEQDGQTYWHIMDPFTGRPADNGLISVTIVGDEGVVCDGLSTALFVMGLEKATDLWAQSGDFEAAFVLSSGEVYITEGLTDRFALTDSYADTPISVIRR